MSGGAFCCSPLCLKTLWAPKTRPYGPQKSPPNFSKSACGVLLFARFIGHSLQCSVLCQCWSASWLDRLLVKASLAAWLVTLIMDLLRAVQMRLLYKLALWRTDECPLIREFAKKVLVSIVATSFALLCLEVRWVSDCNVTWVYY